MVIDEICFEVIRKKNFIHLYW